MRRESFLGASGGSAAASAATPRSAGTFAPSPQAVTWTSATLASESASAATNQGEPVVLKDAETAGIADGARPNRFIDVAIIVIALAAVIALMRLGEPFFVPL